MSDTNDTRQEFEAWFSHTFISDCPWDEARNCYVEYDCHMAWKGWQAATALAKAAQWKLMDNFPPVDLSVGLRKVILWDSRLKAHRIGHPLLENTSDCTHWMALPVSPAIQEGSAV